MNRNTFNINVIDVIDVIDVQLRPQFLPKFYCDHREHFSVFQMHSISTLLTCWIIHIGCAWRFSTSTLKTIFILPSFDVLV